jgi:hypothetical protein
VLSKQQIMFTLEKNTITPMFAVFNFTFTTLEVFKKGQGTLKKVINDGLITVIRESSLKILWLPLLMDI